MPADEEPPPPGAPGSGSQDDPVEALSRAALEFDPAATTALIPLQALAAALAEVHRHSVLLGASLPPRALLDAVTRLDPTVVFVWAQTPGAARRAELAALRRHRHLDASSLVLGGPGWPTGTAGRVPDLAGAGHACTIPVFPYRRGSRLRPGLAS